MRDPSHYDFRTDEFDVEETYAQDIAGMDVEYWAKFRYAIAVGHYNDSGKPLQGPGLNEAVIDSYRDLGKAHYQAISNLSEAHMSLSLAEFVFPPSTSNPTSFTFFQKSVGDFYYHLGCILDALARLIYNLCDPDSVSHTERFEGREVHLRKRINYYLLRSESRSCLKGKAAQWGFEDYVKHPLLQEIVNIRDALTHGYKIPAKSFRWPEEAKRQQWLAWPHGELESGTYEYKDLIIDVLRKHLFDFIPILNEAFRRLIAKVPEWEANHSVRIV